MCNTTQAVEILGEVYVSCSAILKHSIQDAYLYGSYARGDYTKESDIDILLTSSLTSAEIEQCRYAIAYISSDLSLKHDITVSITVKAHEQFQHYQNVLPYYRNVIQEGIRYAG